MSIHTPKNLSELRQAVVDLRHAQLRGGGTKPALSHSDMRGAVIDVSQLQGVRAYDPGEYTFTAMAGTPLREIRDMLSEHGQFLPFDPPLVEAGATLGGTVAAGLSGAGRLRYGGVRDFLLGCQLVTGEGRVVFGGGKVVKNAAGFDIPKLMVGSQGAYGALAELTFKVFPRPEAYATLEIECDGLDAALQLQSQIAASPLEPACLDLLPPGRLLVRVGGLSSALPARVRRLKDLCRGATELIEHTDDESLWREASEFQWCVEHPVLARIPISPNEIPTCDAILAASPWDRRYSVAGNLAWISSPTERDSAAIERLADQLGPLGSRSPGSRDITVLRGQRRLPGAQPGDDFRRRLRTVFDPQGKFSNGNRVSLG